MLEKLTLTNFRKVRSDTMGFTAGMNVLRGANSVSKTTRIEACAYALFGSKALRTTLEAAVTHGEDVKTLKVVLTIRVGGKAYAFSRSKAGAEVVLDGKVFCTGQNEVSALAGQLIGADANLAANLMFSAQQDVRGALSQGPKALSELIEKLAGFQVFDTLLEAAQSKLALGSPALMEERLKGAEATLAAATETMPAQPEDPTQKVATINSEIIRLINESQSLKYAAEKASDDFSKATDLYLERCELDKAVLRTEEQFKLAKANVAGQSVNANKVAPDLEPLKAAFQEAKDWYSRSEAYKVFCNMKDGDRYEGTEAQYEEDLLKFSQRNKADQDLFNRLEREISILNGKRLNHTHCDKCGQSVEHLASVVETNAKVDAELATLLPKKVEVESALKAQAEVSKEFGSYRSLNSLIASDLKRLNGFVTLDETVFPVIPTWVGSLPSAVGPSVINARTNLETAEAEVKAIDQAKVRLELVQGQMQNAKEALEKALLALGTRADPTADEILNLKQAKEDAISAVNANDGFVILAQREIDQIQAEFKSASALWAMSKSRIDDATKVIADTKKDLASLEGNNNLVKKLRALRPVIANQIWNTVLASVSVMFSSMRGQESWVTKEKAGFCVNGQAVESLSGSELDLMGVALRVALLKTFIPTSSLLILDEPAASMDANRTEALVGFIASCGMTQSILITHESISETVCDNLILLGE